jgi:hypothetical protein
VQQWKTETHINFQILWTEQVVLPQIIQIIKTDELKVVDELHKIEENKDNDEVLDNN